MTECIYLDHNSTSPIEPSVARVMAECYDAGFVNPASQHRPGQLARRKLEQLRRRMSEILGARCVGMQTDHLVFTSGGTESNNLAVCGLALATQSREPVPPRTVSPGDSPVIPMGPSGRVLISAIEHPSIVGAAEHLVRSGWSVEKIPVDSNGIIRLSELEKMLDRPTSLVSIMLANNETGVIQPVVEAAQMCRRRDVLIHTDAVQMVGKMPVNFVELGVDALSFTAHKLGGPRGIGGLVLRHGIAPLPILFGGFQQMAIRPGTEDVALAAGMCQALELRAVNPLSEQISRLRDRLQSNLLAEFDDLVVNGGQVNRTPQTLNISFPNVDRQSFLLAADMAGLAISTGSACASGSSELSPVLLAMGLEKRVVEGSIRVSLGVSTTKAEIDESSRRMISIIHDFRARN